MAQQFEGKDDEPDVLTPAQQKSIIDFDPFAVTDEEIKEVARQNEDAQEVLDGEAPTEEAPEGEEPTEAEAAEVAEEAPAGEPTPEDGAWQQRLVEAISQLNRPQPPAPSPQAPSEETPPAYNFQVRTEIAEALASEDANVRAQAINAIANGVAQSVHAQVRKETREHMAQAIQGYVARHITQKSVQDEIAHDFYGKYPELNTPARRAAVIEVAKSVYDGKSQWSPALRDKIAQATAKELGFKLAGPAGQQSGNGAVQNKQSGAAAAKVQGRKPPRQMAGGTRPGTPAKQSQQVADIADTLFGSDSPRR